MPAQIVYELPKVCQVLTGMKFERWTVLRFAHRKIFENKSAHNFWECQCSCERKTIRIVNGPSLLSGLSLSCGCLCRERTSAANTTHGHTKGGVNHPLCCTHRNMMNRCYCPSSGSYKNYGAKGVRVEKEWHNVANFIRDMEPTWNGGYNAAGDKLTIDRISSATNYGPGLCKWSTELEQSNNISSNVKITANGKTLNRAQWARELGISPNVLMHRAALGWTDDQMINIPVGERRGCSKKGVGRNNA